LKGIQQGKVKDTFGWNIEVGKVDASKYDAGKQANGVNGENVDRLP